MRYLRTNTATRITVGPFLDKTDGITPKVAITVTSEHLTLIVDTAGVPTLILDVAPTASGGNNDMVHVTNDDAGYYDLELAATDVNYLGRAALCLNDVVTHCPVFHEFMIVPAVVYDALVLGTDNLDVDTVGALTGLIASDVGAIKTTIGTAGAGLTAIPNSAGITSILADYARRTGDYATVTALSTLQGNVTTILADYARRSGDYATVAALSTLQSAATAIKAITDQIVFTIAHQVDANALSGGGSGLTAAQTRAALGLASANLDTQLANILASAGAGSGAITWVYNLLDPLSAPIADAMVWVTSDIGGAHILASGRTDAYGNVTFYLDAGTVYVWCQKAGMNFTNPDTEVVS